MISQVPPYLVDSGLHGGLPLPTGHVRQGTRRISRARSHILLLKDEYVLGHRGHTEMSSILAVMTNSALVYEPKWGGGGVGGLRTIVSATVISTDVHMELK